MGEAAEEVCRIWNTEEPVESFLELVAVCHHVTSAQIIHLLGYIPISNFFGRE